VLLDNCNKVVSGVCVLVGLGLFVTEPLNVLALLVVCVIVCETDKWGDLLLVLGGVRVLLILLVLVEVFIEDGECKGDAENRIVFVTFELEERLLVTIGLGLFERRDDTETVCVG
jgi:hypothetical protein